MVTTPTPSETHVIEADTSRARANEEAAIEDPEDGASLIQDNVLATSLPLKEKE